jgi:hypothetical protein
MLGSVATGARATAYVLVLISFTAVAGMGGYELGARSRPTNSDIAAGRTGAVQQAVQRAVAARAAADRALRRRYFARAISFEHARDMATIERRLLAQQVADGREAALAYRRGRTAGAAQAKAHAERAGARSGPAAPSKP